MRKATASCRFSTPEELFFEALSEGASYTPTDLRLLLSGLTALHDARMKKLNTPELRSIKSLIAYTAHTQKIDEDKICALLSARYGVNETRNLPSWAYQDAVHFLVDLDVKKLVN